MNIFDTHAHYDDRRFNKTRHAILRELPSKGVSLVLCCASNLESARSSIEYANRYPFVYASVGVHPHEAENAPLDFVIRLRELAAAKKVVAIGEIGLDYHYDFSPRDIQKKVFETQIILANELSLPVVIHDREAHADTLDMIKKHRPKGVVHCYSGSAETALELYALGMYFGFGGALTFPNAKNAVRAASAIPMERILLETDCPYMAPVPHRGETCTSDMIEFVAQKLAEIKGLQKQTVIDICRENGKELFSI